MSKHKVLLTENSNIVLQIEKRYLKDAPVTIFTATNGEEALTVARKVKPDLVYMAFGLSGMNGAACCKAMKSDPEMAGIPVVMVYGGAEEDLDLCRAAGCDAIIAKPLDRREFLEAGRVFLSKMARSEERIPCRATVSCLLGDATFYGTIEDICANGMFVGANCNVVPGDLMTLKFMLPCSGAALIETRAQVAWVNGEKRRRNSYLPPGFGAVFRELRSDVAEQINDYMELTRLRLT
jgi:CheY-like chemotaxis protein